MKLKSHLRLNRGEERRARRPRSRLLTLVSVATLTVGFAGFGIAMTAGPALADPTCQEIAGGSDTIQDVMNQFSVDLGGNLLCSYNAIDPVSGTALANVSYIRGPNATQPKLTCTYTRANGSGDGVIALRESLNTATTATAYGTPAPLGCEDIGRSSSSPAASGNQNTGGALIYVPFAEDAVTGAIGPATGGTVQGINGPVATVATSLPSQVNTFTLANLVSLYTNCAVTTVGGVAFWPFEAGVTQPAGTQRIDLYVPQSGSGTRNFWATTLGFPSSSLEPCITATIDQGTLAGGNVEEHNGTAVATDTDGYMPFSIAQWISQNNHTTGDAIDLDRRYGAVLQDVNGVSPFSGTIMNSAFPINREVYNVMAGCRIVAGAPVPFTGATCSIDPNLQAMFVGSGSSLCQDAITILHYGFALLPNANETDACGATTTSLWAYVPPV